MSTALIPGVTPRVVVRARAVNTGGEALRRLRVSLRFGQPVRGRSAIAAGTPLARLGTRVGDTELGDGELAAGGTADANFDVLLTKVPFRHSRTPAVYPMRIEVRSNGVVRGAADTYVMWWPGANPPRVKIAWVWPLAERSHRAVGDDFYDDELANAVDDGGRLRTILDVGTAAKVPLTWAVDPETLDSVRRVAGGHYTVRGQEGTSATPAREWLDAARTALRTARVLPLPYADPDLDAIAAGALATDAGRAFTLGRDVLRRELGNAGDGSLAWPPGPTLAPNVEGLLSAEGVKGVLLPETALPMTESLNYTPTAPTPLAQGALGSLTALMADSQLSDFVASPDAALGPRLAAQRFLADTALIALERPNTVRDVVVPAPRGWDPGRDFAFQLLDLTASSPWLVPTGLDDMLDDEPSGAARTRTPTSGGVLTSDQVKRVLDERRLLQRVRGILTDPKRAPESLTALDDTLLRAVSSAWAGDAIDGHRLTDSADTAIRGELQKIRVLPAGVVTMTGRSGRIPLTFQNDFGQTVRVKLRLDSKHRLALKNGAGYERGQDVPIAPGTTTFVIEGKATTGGLFPIKVELLGADGAQLLPATTLRVRSTAYGVVALGVTAGAFGLLLVASATRLVQRRRRAKAA
jgi:hypothetical protein